MTVEQGRIVPLKEHSQKKFMTARTRTLLTEGLLSGFASEMEPEHVDRGTGHISPPFTVHSNQLEKANGAGEYVDQWLAHKYGGGQELVDTYGVYREQFTRLYAGGIAKPEILQELGITEKEIIGQLKKFLQELGDKTRLDQDCIVRDGNWDYRYTVSVEEDVPLIIARERMLYRRVVQTTDRNVFKRKTVFVHGFLLCPVE